MDFYPVITEDGSISLYNTTINDIYHSKVGAYTEALNKFVIPSGILERALVSKKFRILDICYGMGYNSKSAITEVLKITPYCTFEVDIIENDPYVLAFSTLLQDQNLSPMVEDMFTDSIAAKLDLNSYYIELSKTLRLQQPYNQDLLIDGDNKLHNINLDPLLHNIYYRTLSNRNNITYEFNNDSSIARIELYAEDLRSAINKLISPYDIVFHDAFTPIKQPSLWTKDLFSLIYKLLNDNGVFVTYSSSPSVRSGLVEAGFHIGNTLAIGRKSPGTIAVKDISLIKHPLSLYEKGMLNTKSGIPYYDYNFPLLDSEILNNRTIMQNISSRESLSAYKKRYIIENIAQ